MSTTTCFSVIRKTLHGYPLIRSYAAAQEYIQIPVFTGVILELSEKKFWDNLRISGRSFGPIFGFPYTFYTFSLLPQLKIGRSQPA